MTRPPCKRDGVECPKRYIGCRAECEQYHEWLAIHAEEKERIRRNRDNEHAADTFLALQNKRVQAARHREYIREKRR